MSGREKKSVQEAQVFVLKQEGEINGLQEFAFARILETMRRLGKGERIVEDPLGTR